MHDPLADHLLPLAKKYLWWMPPEEAVTMPNRIVAQVMNLGDYDDVPRGIVASGRITHRILNEAILETLRVKGERFREVLPSGVLRFTFYVLPFTSHEIREGPWQAFSIL